MGVIGARHEQLGAGSPKGQHFMLLDGLRGAAAVAVAGYHFQGRAELGFHLPHGYLAVDFFFVLSGFVVAHAYLHRLRTSMTASTFIWLRVIRLWPMLVPGTALGAVFEFWRPVAQPGRHLAEVAIAAVLGMAAIPILTPTSMEQTIFPINGPVWSLLFEMVASVVFLVAAKSALPRLSAAGLMLCGLVGLVGYDYAYGTLDVGALLGNWPGGAPRVLFSFFAGVLLTPLRHHFPTTSPAVPALALTAILLAPGISAPVDAALDLVAVILCFPIIVATGSNCAVRGRLGAVCRQAGNLSYPLYAIHYPIIRAICFVLNKTAIGLPARLAVFTVTLPALCAISWLVFKAYDEPVRKALTRRFLPKPMMGIERSGPVPMTLAAHTPSRFSFLKRRWNTPL